jgi:hypothetical protein
VVTARSRAKKRRKKKAQKSAQNRARGPAIFLIFAFVATGILLIAQVDQGPSSDSTPIALDNTTIAPGLDLSTAPINTDAIATVPSATDPSNLGNPVTVHSDTLGDLDVDQVIDDWTGVEPPQIPADIAKVGSATLEGEYIADDLADGIYIGYLLGALDENEEGFVFDIRDSFEPVRPENEGLKLYAAYLDSVLFVSLSTSGEANSAISVAKYFELAKSNTSELQIPNTDLSAIVTGSPMLLTIVGGAIIAIEGVDAL